MSSKQKGFVSHLKLIRHIVRNGAFQFNLTGSSFIYLKS